MKDELISFETAKLAKEKGFSTEFNTEHWYNQDGNKNHYYQVETFPCVTQSLLQKWLREVHNAQIKVVHERGYKCWYKHSVKWVHALGGYTSMPTYEKALEKGLQKALKHI